MKSYDETVDDMMRFLKSKAVCSSSINSHRSCYQQFQQFMYEHGKQWEPAAVSDWISELKQKETSSLYSIWNLYTLTSAIWVLIRPLFIHRSRLRAGLFSRRSIFVEFSPLGSHGNSRFLSYAAILINRRTPGSRFYPSFSL